MLTVLSHISKILINVVKTRFKDLIDQKSDKDLFDFRKGQEIRGAILTLNINLES